jgi:hypothetical protein
MFERIGRFVRKVVASLEPEDDRPRPQRVDPDPPRDEWFGRVRSRSLDAAARKETKKLDALDKAEPEPALPHEAAKAADDLLSKIANR